MSNSITVREIIERERELRVAILDLLQNFQVAGEGKVVPTAIELTHAVNDQGQRVVVDVQVITTIMVT